MTIGTLLTYGTLRPGNENNTVLIPGYKMFDLGPFPGVVKGGPFDVIVCQRIDVESEEDLAAYDRYEGCYNNNDRASLYIRAKDGPDWIYLYNRDISNYPLVTNGDWLRHKREGALQS